MIDQYFALGFLKNGVAHHSGRAKPLLRRQQNSSRAPGGKVTLLEFTSQEETWYSSGTWRYREDEGR